jgi:hypothetical protein
MVSTRQGCAQIAPLDNYRMPFVSREFAARVSFALLRLAWAVVRLPMLALLRAFEPFVRFTLPMLTVFSVLTACVFEFSGVLLDFPFWLMLGFGLACALAQLIYDGTIRAFSS